MRRRLSETLERRKEAMIAALWSNSGFEGSEGSNARKEAIMDLERHYDEAIEAIQSGNFGKQQEEEIDDKYGFFAAGKRGEEKIQSIGVGVDSDRAAMEAEILASSSGLDQS
jgi:hypothetical protein